jgi:head-tail adaptor
VTAAPKLTRPLVLEARERVADGAGGFSDAWVTLGMLWAEVKVRTGREDFIAAVARPRVRYRIVVRAAPLGSASRPRAEQRLREGTRDFDILTVAEFDAGARYLEIVAEEGLAA